MSRARKPARKPARTAARNRKPAMSADCVAAPAAPAPVSAASPGGLKLEASCTLRDSIDMQFQLLAVDFGDAEVLVDGSAVERIDTAGLQLLLSFAEHHMARGKTLRWTGVSPELARGGELLGIAALLGLPGSAADGEAHGD